MNTNQGRLHFSSRIDNNQLRNDAAETRNLLHSIGQTAKQESESMDLSLSRIAKATAGIFATGKMMEFAKQIISTRGEIERLEISFETLAGKTKGEELFKGIRQFAATTPMMMKDLAQGAQTMLAFNIEAEKVMPMLRAIGDISLGDAQKFNSLSLAFSQMSATGKLMGQDLNQMINAGFNPLAEISRKTGKSIGELKEEAEKGRISVEMVTEAFMSATSEGGKFYQMLTKQGQSMDGAIAQMQGAIDDALNDMGKQMQGTVVTLAEAGTYLAKHYDTLLAVVGSVVAVYGTYRAALMANIAIEQMMESASAKRLAIIETEINAVGLKTAEQQLSMDADIAEAVAKGNLTQAEGLHILALKQEAAQRVESLALAAKQAAATAAEATAARQAAAVKLRAAESNAAAARLEYEAILAKGEVFEIALAKERMETAQSQINAAAQEYQAAATAETTAAKAAQTAQTTANTAAQQLNNIAVQQGTAKTGVFATATRMLTNTLKSLWATMMKHPMALVLAAMVAAMVAVGAAIYNLTKKSKELNEEQKILDDVTGKASASVAEQKTKVETLSKIIHDNTKKLQERKTAISELQKIVPDYHASLTKEGNLINDNTEALNRYIEALMKAAKVEALKGGITDTYKQLSSIAMDVKGRRSDFGTILNMFSTDEGIEKNKQMWEKWYKEFLDDPTKFTRKDKNGRTEVLFGEGVGAQWLNADMDTGFLGIMGEISKQERDLIRAAEKYAEYSRLYQNVLSEEVSTKGTEKPDVWKDKVAEEQKKLTKAQAELKKLKASATATVAEVKDAQDKADAAKKALKELGVNTDKETKAGEKASEVKKTNDDMLANEAANRRKKEEEYAKQLKDQIINDEFELRQAKIEAMKDGIDKELEQNQLNYDRLIEQNRRRQRDYLDDLADERIRKMEDETPTLFKKKNKDGKWEETPGAREETYREIRTKLTIEDLSQEQKAQIEEFGRSALVAFEKSNKDSMDKMLQEVMTYEQQRTRIAEEYARKRNALYEQETYIDTDGKQKQRTKTGSDGQPVARKGITKGNFDELSRQEREALKALDEQFAQREETYQAWCESIANLSLKDLEKTLAQAKGRLDELSKTTFAGIDIDSYVSIDGQADMEALTNALDDAKNRIDELRRDGRISVDGEADMEALTNALDDAKNRIKQISDEEIKQLIMARAMVSTAEAAVKKARAKNDMNPGKRTIKEWEDLYKTLNDVEKEFESIGNTVDGVVGEIVSECGSMASSTLQMINGIVTLANWSAISIKMTAEGASAAIQTMEKASVILTIISAAMQIAMQIANLFNTDSKKQEEIESLQERIDQLQWELDHQDVGRVQSQYGTAIQRLNKALAESRRELAAGTTGWERFALMAGRASRNTELMQKAAGKLAQTYATMSYTVDKALGEDKYRSANDQLKNLAQQQILLQEQINAEASKKKTDDGAIQEWRNKIEELGQKAVEIINDMVEDIIGDTSSGIAEELADAFFDAFQAGEDAAKAWGDKVNEIVADITKRMLVSKFLEEPLGEIFDSYKSKWFKDGKFQGIDSIVNSMQGFTDDLNAVGADFMQIWKSLPESVKGLIEMTDSASQQGASTSFSSMTQETGNAIEGRLTALLVTSQELKTYTANMEGIMKESLQAAHELRDSMEEFVNIGITSMGYLESIANHTRNLNQMREDLEKIERHVKDF